MADPISLFGRNESLVTGGDEELMSLSLTPPAAGPPPPDPPPPTPPASAPSPDAVKTLVGKFDKPIAAPPSGPFDRSLYNVTERTPDGASVRSAVGVYELHNADKSAVTVLEASSQMGKNYDAQLTGLRSSFAFGHAGYGFALTGDVAAARLNKGVDNDDGSVGYNIGATAEAAGLEATLSTPVASFTLGGSISVGASSSSGLRDADGDGQTEYCTKVSIPAFTVGACVERFW